MRRASERAKPWHIESSSGEEPQSHLDVLEAVTSTAREPLHHTDTFICDGAVNVVQLLRATRNSLMELAEFIGANALVEEKSVSSAGSVAAAHTLQMELHDLWA